MERDNTTKLLADQLRGIDGQIKSISDDVYMQQLCTSFFNDAVTGLSSLKETFPPESHHQIDTVALSFASLATSLSAYFAFQVREHEEARRRGAEIKQDIHNLIVGVAQARAIDAWKLDQEKKIRIGEMSEKIWVEMLDAGHVKFLPDKADGLQKWIAPVAPSYARAPGRPRKQPQ